MAEATDAQDASEKIHTQNERDFGPVFFNAFFALFNADKKTTKKVLSITPYMYT